MNYLKNQEGRIQLKVTQYSQQSKVKFQTYQNLTRHYKNIKKQFILYYKQNVFIQVFGSMSQVNQRSTKNHIVDHLVHNLDQISEIYENFENSFYCNNNGINTILFFDNLIQSSDQIRAYLFVKFKEEGGARVLSKIWKWYMDTMFFSYYKTF